MYPVDYMYTAIQLYRDSYHARVVMIMHIELAHIAWVISYVATFIKVFYRIKEANL